MTVRCEQPYIIVVKVLQQLTVRRKVHHYRVGLVGVVLKRRACLTILGGLPCLCALLWQLTLRGSVDKKGPVAFFVVKVRNIMCYVRLGDLQRVSTAGGVI